MSEFEYPESSPAPKGDRKEMETARVENVPARTDFGGGALPAEALDLSWLEPAKVQGAEFTGLLHSLRRQWLAGLGIGTLVAALTAAVLWFLIPVSYRAQSLLLVQQDGAFGRDGYRTPTEIEQTMANNAQLMRQPFVIEAAFRDPNIFQLEMVQYDRFGRKRPNPIAWLQEELGVSYLPDSAVLQVMLRGEDDEAIVALVDAVVQSYMTNVVGRQVRQQSLELEELRNTYKQNSDEIQAETSAVENLRRSLKTGDTQQARMMATMFLDEIRNLNRQLMEAEQEAVTIKSELDMRRLVQANRVLRPLDWQVEDILRMSDSRYGSLMEQIALLEERIAEASRRLRPGAAGPIQLENELEELKFEKMQLEQQKMPEAIERYRRMYYNVDPEIERLELAALQTNLASTQQRMADLRQQITDKQAFLDQFDVNAAALETKLARVADLRAANMRLQEQIGQLQLNIKTQNPVEVLQPATIPDINSFWFKVVQVFGASMFALLAVTGGIAYWDFLGKRVNTAKDLDGISGMSIVASLPQITPAGAMSLLPMRQSTRRTLQLALSRSIDSLRTALLCHRENRELNVVMVTSALAQEGKTTVASQLAASLARSGRRTLLVDGDLRNPQQHTVLGISGEPGACEFLRSEATLDDVVRPTSVTNMWAIPAGRRNEAIDPLLSSDTAQEFFRQLRDRFDYVVVDVGPVLANPDAMLIGQFVDTALLAVRRDTSVVPKVRQAYDRLRSVGVHVFGTVLSGEGWNVRASELRPSAPITESRPRLQKQM